MTTIFPGSGMSKNQDPGSGINIPDPQHCFYPSRIQGVNKAPDPDLQICFLYGSWGTGRPFNYRFGSCLDIFVAVEKNILSYTVGSKIIKYLTTFLKFLWIFEIANSKDPNPIEDGSSESPTLDLWPLFYTATMTFCWDPDCPAFLQSRDISL
jgi:hypothetical protein